MKSWNQLVWAGFVQGDVGEPLHSFILDKAGLESTHNRVMIRVRDHRGSENSPSLY